MKGRNVVILLLCFLLVLCPPVFADRGMISLSPDASIYEPGQKAIVAWNGHEEILVLSTDVYASKETLVLEIIPLPSRPGVEGASTQCFQEVQSMIWTYGGSRTFGMGEQGTRGDGVEILFHEEIGAHNITVVSATETGGLLELADSFLLTSGVTYNVSLQGLQGAIESYLNRGFKYFSLDLVTFSTQEKSVEPILYRFNTSMLYYPLVITSPLGGNGNITVFALTGERIDEIALFADHIPMVPAYYSTYNGQKQFIQFRLPSDELVRMDLRLNDLLPNGAWLSVLKRDGNLSSLNQDLILTSRDFDLSNGPVYIILPISASYLGFVLSNVIVGVLLALAGFAFSHIATRRFRKKQADPEHFALQKMAS